MVCSQLHDHLRFTLWTVVVAEKDEKIVFVVMRATCALHHTV